MYRKYFFKNKGVLSRKFVASGLAAVFIAGVFGSYAGAMKENSIDNIIIDNKSDQYLNEHVSNNFEVKINKNEIDKFLNDNYKEKEQKEFLGQFLEYCIKKAETKIPQGDELLEMLELSRFRIVLFNNNNKQTIPKKRK